MGYDQRITLERLKAVSEILEKDASAEIADPTVEGLAAISFEMLHVVARLREMGNDIYDHAEEIAGRLTGHEVMADGKRAADKVADALPLIEGLTQNFQAAWKSSFEIGKTTQTIEPGKSRLVDAPDADSGGGEWVRDY